MKLSTVFGFGATGIPCYHKNCFVRLSVVISLLVYSVLMPSAVFFYDYIPAADIIDDIAIDASPNATSGGVPMCPLVPSSLDKQLYVNLLPESSTAAVLGGAWRPMGCVPRHHVAIIVPYRNRESQLSIFLNHMHSFLQSQMLDYRIFAIEQSPELQFNRAALFNIGFLESRKVSNFHCFIFHDVDLLPLNSANMYACSRNPRHMSVAVNTLRFTLPYSSIFGGAVAMTREQFTFVNGFSNSFFGWGGEDDDMFNRILHRGMKVSRWDPRICRYFMLSHSKELPSDARHSVLASGKDRYEIDGINSVKYEVIRHHETDSVTRIVIRLPS